MRDCQQAVGAWRKFEEEAQQMRKVKLALRDILYRKIKGSKKMEFGLNAYIDCRTSILRRRTNSCCH